MNYIQEHYNTVTLDELSEAFHLSTPYLSKYIKERTGKTFGDIVKETRLTKACTLLKSGNMTVESISYAVGYENVEHFNRLFKRSFDCTPVQYRNGK